jgi:hypothetical protein
VLLAPWFISSGARGVAVLAAELAEAPVEPGSTQLGVGGDVLARDAGVVGLADELVDLLAGLLELCLEALAGLALAAELGADRAALGLGVLARGRRHRISWSLVGVMV